MSFISFEICFIAKENIGSIKRSIRKTGGGLTLTPGEEAMAKSLLVFQMG